jgi:aspartokinase
VSAFEGVTDQLIREAAADLIATDTEEATATYIAQGEQRTAALLVESLTRSGMPSRVIEPYEIGLLAEGSSLDSTPVGVDLCAFCSSSLTTSSWRFSASHALNSSAVIAAACRRSLAN